MITRHLVLGCATLLLVIAATTGSAQNGTLYIALPECSSLTPERCTDPQVRARYEKERDEKEARDRLAQQQAEQRKAEEARRFAETEARRKAEIARVEAETAALIKGQMDRYGYPPQREADARHAVELQKAAAAARKKRNGPVQVIPF